jgi:hypothetical protein
LCRSRFVADILLQHFHSPPHKLRIFQQLTEPLLKMNDSLMKRRIHWLLTPFSPSSISGHPSTFTK